MSGYFLLLLCSFFFFFFFFFFVKSFTAVGDDNSFFANSVDPDETAHPEQDLRCLTFSLSALHINLFPIDSLLKTKRGKSRLKFGAETVNGFCFPDQSVRNLAESISFGCGAGRGYWWPRSLSLFLICKRTPVINCWCEKLVADTIVAENYKRLQLCTK